MLVPNVLSELKSFVSYFSIVLCNFPPIYIPIAVLFRSFTPSDTCVELMLDVPTLVQALCITITSYYSSDFFSFVLYHGPYVFSRSFIPSLCVSNLFLFMHIMHNNERPCLSVMLLLVRSSKWSDIGFESQAHTVLYVAQSVYDGFSVKAAFSPSTYAG